MYKKLHWQKPSKKKNLLNNKTKSKYNNNNKLKLNRKLLLQ